MDKEKATGIVSKLGPCEVCNKNEAKYTCPKCEVKTCCLECVNIHKKELDCDGLRQKVKFIYTPNFTNMDIINDYKLLEETSRFVYSKKRNPLKRYTSINRDLPLHLHKLKAAARKRGTVLLYLLENFKRHKNNTSRLNYKLDKIFWRIEWVFLNAFPKPMKMCENKCHEDTKLVHFLNKYFDPSNVEVESNSKLAFYQSASMSNCRILLKAERIKSSGKKYHELDVRLSLKDNFAGKCIVEYPTIFVILKDHSYDLKIVDSDDEHEIGNEDSIKNTFNDAKDIGENRQQNRQSFTAKYAKQQKLQIEKEIAISRKNKPKNFLFNSDYSSSDDLS